MIVLTSWVKCPLVFYPGSNFINLEAILSILFRLARSWLNIGRFSISLMIPVSVMGAIEGLQASRPKSDSPGMSPLDHSLRRFSLLHILVSGLAVSELAVGSLV